MVEVANIFRRRGPAWRASHADPVSLGQLKVMSAIGRCRTGALRGHVERCSGAILNPTRVVSETGPRNCRACPGREWHSSGRKGQLVLSGVVAGGMIAVAKAIIRGLAISRHPSHHLAPQTSASPVPAQAQIPPPPLSGGAP